MLLLLPALIFPGSGQGRTLQRFLKNVLWVVLGYALVMSPWLIHNLWTTGRLLSTAGTKTLFLTTYDDLYSFGKKLDWQAYLAWGVPNILQSKLEALWANLQTYIAVDALVFLAPLVAIGLWQRRHDRLYQVVMLYGLGLYLVMSLGFTFPGMRGGMFHSSAALLPFLFAAAMIGLDTAVGWVAARRARWNVVMARRVFTWGLVAFAIVFTCGIYLSRIQSGNQADAIYKDIGAWLQGQVPGIVMVNDPPGYFYHTRQPAIVIPNGDVDTLLAAARQYGASWVVLDTNRPEALARLYSDPRSDPRLALVETFKVGATQPVYLFRIE